jgi:hypothetical protein
VTDLALDGLASYRLARLLTMDDLTKPPRDRIWKFAQERGMHRLAEFVTCPHCVGVWVAFGVVLVAPRVVPRWRSVRAALAAAGAASALASFVGAVE